MSVSHLKNYLKQMKNCPHDCKIYENLEKLSEYLTDKSNVSLRSKPSDSLSLFYHVMKNYYKIEDKEEACEKLFKTEKFFFLISNMESQYPIFKNKSNRINTITRPLAFLKRFEPYHYDMVFAVNKNGFDRYFYKRNIRRYFN